jgi:arylformamidase
VAERRIYDVSRAVREDTAVWPGDTPFSRRWVMRMEQGDSCNVSTVTHSVHCGTHADAPFHFDPNGIPIDRVDLSKYVGKCLVITARSRDALKVSDLEGIDFAAEERLLVRGPDRLRDDQWRDDFFHCSLEAAQLVARSGLQLLGLDSPSMDFMTSKELAAHKALVAGGVAILESLDLSAVPDGRYELIALPLKMTGGDGSLVRAVLRDLPTTAA